MNRYKCRICGMGFDDPFVSISYEPMPDGFHEKLRTEHCPICGEAYFDEILWDEEEDEPYIVSAIDNARDPWYF